MLTVGVDLHREAIAVPVGVLHPRAKGARQAEVRGKVDDVDAVIMAEAAGPVAGPVVDDHVVNGRTHGKDALDDVENPALLVVGGDYDQHVARPCHDRPPSAFPSHNK